MSWRLENFDAIFSSGSFHGLLSRREFNSPQTFLIFHLFSFDGDACTSSASSFLCRVGLACLDSLQRPTAESFRQPFARFTLGETLHRESLPIFRQNDGLLCETHMMHNAQQTERFICAHLHCYWNRAGYFCVSCLCGNCSCPPEDFQLLESSRLEETIEPFDGVRRLNEEIRSNGSCAQ